MNFDESSLSEISNRLTVLKNVSLFSFLEDEALLTIAQEAQSREVIEDEFIFHEGDDPDGLYVILSGEIQIVKGDIPLAILRKNDFFGEVALLNFTRRLASAKALTNGMLLYLDLSTIDEIFSTFPQFLLEIADLVLGYLDRELSKQEKMTPLFSFWVKK